MRVAPTSIPPSVIPRLTRYLAYVQQLCEEKAEWVSSKDLALAFGLTSSTVRQDLSHVDFTGVSKRGYRTHGLRKVLEGLLGADRPWRLAVIGAGNLGMALARHEEFQRRGFHICGVFDADEKKVGRRVGRMRVRRMRELPLCVGRQGVSIGVIAVPAAAAQPVADLLIASGIRGLLNLTLAHIIAPRRVAVIDSRIVASLLELAHAIHQRGRRGAR